MEVPPKREYTIINFEGNDRNDNISLQYARILLDQWKIAKDTLQGINFHFGRKAKYWTFIEAINVLKAAGIEWYIPYKNDLFANYTSSYFKPRPSTIYDCLLCNDVIIEKVDEPVSWSSALHKSITLIEDYWAPGIVFIIMTVLTFHRLYGHRKSFNMTK